MGQNFSKLPTYHNQIQMCRYTHRNKLRKKRINYLKQARVRVGNTKQNLKKCGFITYPNCDCVEVQSTGHFLRHLPLSPPMLHQLNERDQPTYRATDEAVERLVNPILYPFSINHYPNITISVT